MSERIMVYRKVETKKRIPASNPQRTDLQNHKKSPIHRILILQKTIGNKAVERLINRGSPERKPPGSDLVDDEFAERLIPGEKPINCPRCRDNMPHQGSATIVCDGSGGYRVHMGWAATATCGISDCVRRHEESHIADWRGRWPDGCRNADGSTKPDGATVPTGGPGYDAFLRTSECRAYNIEIPCEEALLRTASAGCRPVVQNVLDDSRRQRRNYCGR